MSAILYFKGATKLSLGIFYFTSMEILQALQYSYIAESLHDDQCNHPMNRFLTSVGLLHICFQPYVINMMSQYSQQTTKKIQLFHERFVIIKRMCLVIGTWLFVRHLIGLRQETGIVGVDSTEWLQCDKLCTYKGNLHLAWAVPMADVSYYMPSSNAHLFFMFVPAMLMYENKRMVITQIIFFITGPLLAAYITSNLMEQASIWCFFSIFQCALCFYDCVKNPRYSENKVDQITEKKE
jgi:hypothetical protein